ncbi:MAG: hypothetical protein LC789_09855, partial [Actinobacteria bacterium]|nr:hypothetical protein [Actinomycetota bacterium]
PEPHEDPIGSADLFDVGEPLYCSGIHRMQPRAAHRALRARGYSPVTWQALDGEQLGAAPASGVIVGAAPAAPNGVHVLVADVGGEGADQRYLPEQNCDS